MKPETRKMVTFAAFALLTVAFDQVTKIWARANLPQLGYAGHPVIEGKFILRYSENPGVAFGMLQKLPGGRIVLTIVALIALGLVISYLRKTDPQQRRLQVALGLIFGGAVGNLIDRIGLGAVTDFLLVDLGVWPLNPWPSFNIADAALVIGVGVMAIDMIWPPKVATPGTAGEATPHT